MVLLFCFLLGAYAALLYTCVKLNKRVIALESFADRISFVGSSLAGKELPDVS